MGFPGGVPGGSEGKESACNAGDPGLISGPRRSAGEGNGNPLQYSCLENAMDRGTGGLQSTGSQRVRQNWATNTFTFTSGGSVVKNLPANAGNIGGSRYHICIRKSPWRRKRQPTPVFSPENPMNRGAWQTTVCAVAESETTELTRRWINRLFVLEHYQALFHPNTLSF